MFSAKWKKGLISGQGFSDRTGILGQIWTDKEQKAAQIHYFCIRFHRQLFDSCCFLMKI